jgi:hypothetical protein
MQNGILGGQFITIHVTPEAGCSYASCEVSGHADDGPLDCGSLLAKALAIFKPGRVSVAMSVDDAAAPTAAT